MAKYPHPDKPPKPQKSAETTAFRAKKSFGQNFLINDDVLDRIVESCQLNPEETVLEIGPGQGVLTRALVPYVKRLIAVEKDKALVERLNAEFNGNSVAIYHDDILRFDLGLLPPRIKAIGNLPYYISTPIMQRVIANRERFSDLFMTVQFEFGQRLVARPGGKDYGSLSCYTQFYTEPRMLFKIASKAFRPQPKVESCFMHLAMRETPLFADVDEELMFRLIRQAFSQRRKKMSNCLHGIVPDKAEAANILTKAGIDPLTRPENLDLDAFVRLTRAIVNERQETRDERL